MKLAHCFIAACMLAALVPIFGHTQDATPAPGEYLVDGGWGTLKVERDNGKGAQFSLDALGANAHTCELEGAIEHGIASVSPNEKEKPCRVAFAATAAGIDVKPLTFEECRYFCGVRATFDGIYHKVDPACENAARQQTRNRFKKLYDAKQYQEARITLEPLLTTCAKTLHWTEDGAIRNDLAITQYHLRDYGGCIATLDQFKGDDAKQYLAGLQASEPSSAEMYSAILGPAQHNLMLCERAARQR